jgi:mono/diheme cytochrome c family protein
MHVKRPARDRAHDGSPLEQAMTHPANRILLAAALSVAAATVSAQPPPAASRGELLYTTHCIECHTTQMHWREQRLARDWDSLKAQVRRWQGNAGLGWSEADVVHVARYLNATIYRYPQTSDRVGEARRGTAAYAANDLQEHRP